MKNQSPAITSLADRVAVSLYGMTPVEARQKRICISCKQPITSEVFYSEYGHREYLITALCERCYDKLFEENEDEGDCSEQ